MAERRPASASEHPSRPSAERRVRRLPTIALVALCTTGVAALALGCDRGAGPPAPSTSASGKPKTPDRLAPGELAEGKGTLFGLKIPVGMQVDAQFPHSGHASGIVSAAQLADYVRQRVEVARVELGASGTVFPQAIIKGSDRERRYRIEVSSKGRTSKLSVQWLNPAKPPAVTGLSEEKRWERAGITPDGKLIGQQQLE